MAQEQERQMTNETDVCLRTLPQEVAEHLQAATLTADDMRLRGGMTPVSQLVPNHCIDYCKGNH